MKRIFIIFLIFALTSCVTDNSLTSISEKVSNVSDKVVSLVNSEKAEKNLNEQKISKPQNSLNQTKENNVTYKFIEWNCDTFFGGSKVLRTGYFPHSIKNGVSLGALTLETNDEMYASLHTVNGIDDIFTWGGKELKKYMLVIKPGNTAYFFDFSGAKEDEKRESQQTLKCNRKTYDLSLKEVYNYYEDFKNHFTRLGLDLPKMLQK